MKKWIILTLVAALLATGGILGYHFWFQANHIFVETAVYDKELTSLDLRGTGASLDHYEQVRDQLPDCEIRYDLPFQGKFYPDDTREVTVKNLTDEEVALLDYLPELTAVYADGCRDYVQLQALQQRRPELEVFYTVELYGKEYAKDTTELSFGSEKMDLRQMQDVLAYLPEMKSIFFEQPSASPEDLITLQEAFPEISIRWEKDAFGTTYSSDITEIDLTGMRIDTPEVVVEDLKYFPALEKVIMSECGPTEKEWIDNETMAAFREKMRPEYKVVWTVKINNMRVRTDETYFMPNKYGQEVTNYQVQNLRYCEDMLCIDLGHHPITDLSFLEGTPHLKYFICIDSPLIFIEPISNCKELIYCELFWTVVSDYSPLLECTALEDLNVTRTRGDPMFFKNMPWLKNLWITGYWMKPEKKEELSAALPNTFIKFSDNMMAGNGWRDLPNYFAMRDLLGMPYNTW